MKNHWIQHCISGLRAEWLKSVKYNKKIKALNKKMEFRCDRFIGYLLVVFTLYPLFLFSQHQNQYPDTIVDSYNSLTKTSDKFFGGTLIQMGRLVPLNSLYHKSDTFVSLPTGSYVVLAFIDNYIGCT